MILDSSAVVAIALKEPGFESVLSAIGGASRVGIGAPTRVERAVVPFTNAHFGTALEAWLRYGRGRHPAGLNFGDSLR